MTEPQNPTPQSNSAEPYQSTEQTWAQYVTSQQANGTSQSGAQQPGVQQPYSPSANSFQGSAQGYTQSADGTYVPGYQQPGQPYGYQPPAYQQAYQNPVAPPQPLQLYPMTDADRNLRLVAFIFNILSLLLSSVAIIPLAWMIPMCVISWGIYKGTKANTVAFDVCTLIFVSVVGGILLLCSRKDR